MAERDNAKCFFSNNLATENSIFTGKSTKKVTKTEEKTAVDIYLPNFFMDER